MAQTLQPLGGSPAHGKTVEGIIAIDIAIVTKRGDSRSRQTNLLKSLGKHRETGIAARLGVRPVMEPGTAGRHSKTHLSPAKTILREFYEGIPEHKGLPTRSAVGQK